VEGECVQHLCCIDERTIVKGQGDCAWDCALGD
jgi:hypothetical protein